MGLVDGHRQLASSGWQVGVGLGWQVVGYHSSGKLVSELRGWDGELHGYE